MESGWMLVVPLEEWMMRLSAGVKFLMVFGLALGLTGFAWGQDTRTVTEPVFPATCTVLQAQQAISGGEPTSETTFDTTRLQSALTACGAGKAVELTTSGSNNAFLIQPINIPNGVTLLVDGGVTVFASRNPADYQVTGAETCGTVGTAGNGCNPLIKINNNSTSTGAGIMGYGVINGRGGDKLLVGGTPSANSWWDVAAQADVANGDQNNFVLLAMSKASNFTLYKITLENSPMFHVTWKNATGFTAWGVKIITPYTARNSDGIDPQGSNITITHSSISDGDDNVAISASSASANITISNDNTYSGHGISVGSFTQGGLTNMLVTNINQAGTAQDGNGIALRLKSSQDRGGLLSNVTYQNICMQNHRNLINLNPFYNTNSGTSIPKFSNITFRNIHGLTEGLIQWQGHDTNNPLTMTLDNVVFDVLAARDMAPPAEYATITLGPGPVSPAFLQSLTGTGVSYLGSVSNPTEAPYACSASTFTYLVGEMYLSNATVTNQQQLTVGAPGTFTLNAMLQPTLSQVSYSTWTGVVAPTAAVQFMEGSTVVGTGTLSGNGTMASAALTGVTAGTHTYTAVYPGDSTYAAYNFGSVTVTVTPGALASTTTALTALPASVAYGASSIFTAAVSSTTSGTLTGQVQFLDGTKVLGSVPVSGGVATLTQALSGGSHSITAVYSGDTNFATSTSAAAAVVVNAAASATGLVAAPTTLTVGGSSVLTAAVTGIVGGAVPTGAVTFYDGTTSVGVATLDGTGRASYTATFSAVGAHTLTATYAGDGNYGTSQAATLTVTVNGAATTTALSASAATAAARSNVTLTATVASATGTPAGTVTFMNGTVAVGTAALVNGVASFVAPVGAPGTDTFTASYAAAGNFAASTSVPVVVTVTALATTTTLTLSTASTYTGGLVTATVAVSSSGGTPGGSVTLMNGTTVLGALALLNGTSTIPISTGTVQTLNITAVYSALGDFAASTSAASVLSVVSPIGMPVANPTTLSLAAGATGNVAVTVMPGGGFAGTVNFSCTSPVAYVSCTATPASVAAGVNGAQTTVAVSVASTVSEVNAKSGRGVYAVLLPMGLLGLAGLGRRRRGVVRVMLMVVMLAGIAAGMVGCGGSGSSPAPTPGLPPAGPQTVTISATTTTPSGNVNQTLPVTVTVTN
jgi:Glycosyl hydrolases family 28/Bacterial Ig-like domain (group 3)